MIKIPLDAKRFTILNNFDGDPSQMFDGTVNVDPTIGYGQLLNPFEIWYEFASEQKAVIEKVRYYNRYDMPADKALEIYGITAEDAAKHGPWKRTLLFTINNHTQLDFKELQLAKPFAAKYLIFKTWAQGKGQSLPDELQFWGSAADFTEQPLQPINGKPFNQFLGVNTFEWDLMQNREFPWSAEKVYEPNWEPMKHFTNFRHYWGWKSLEVMEGIWNFQPSRNGNWGYDEFYKRCSSEGRLIVPCIKGLPDWMMNTWPEGSWHHEGAPRKSGTDAKDPMAYIEYARTVFQVAARYGPTKVDATLLRGNTWDGTSYHRETPTVTGLGYIKYLEVLNEADAWWWNGRAGYMLPEEYGALLSAVWDGDRGRMGKDVGIKNLGVKLVVAGTAQPTVDWHKGLVRWWQEFRGDELPVAVWNYHLYSNDYSIQKFPWTPGQGSRGVAPEKGRLPWAMQRFTEFNQQIGGDREIWVTETGYDLAQTSPQHAPAIGSRTPEQTQADWLIRTALLLSAAGHDRMMIYQLYDDNVYGGLYGSSGVVNKDQTPRVALRYIEQIRKVLGDYIFDATISTSPRVDRYKKDGAVNRFVAWYQTEDGTMKAFQPLTSKQFWTRLFVLRDNAPDAEVRYETDSFLIGETPLIYEIQERPLIQVMNYLPIADAGRDYEIPFGKTATLTAVDSIDVDGTVTAWKWRKKSGPRKGKISHSTRKSTTVTNLDRGDYIFELTITDDKNGTATDEMTVRVK